MTDQALHGFADRELRITEPRISVSFKSAEVQVRPRIIPVKGGRDNPDFKPPSDWEAVLMVPWESSTNGTMRKAGVEPIILESIDQVTAFLEQLVVTAELPKEWRE